MDDEQWVLWVQSLKKALWDSGVELTPEDVVLAEHTFRDMFSPKIYEDRTWEAVAMPNLVDKTKRRTTT
nr:hypothetical protein [Gemmatimonadaceae bacterium]